MLKVKQKKFSPLRLQSNKNNLNNVSKTKTEHKEKDQGDEGQAEEEENDKFRNHNSLPLISKTIDLRSKVQAIEGDTALQNMNKYYENNSKNVSEYK